MDAFTSNTVADAIEIGQELGDDQRVLGTADAARTGAVEATGLVLEAAAEAAPNLPVGIVVADGVQRVTTTTVAVSSSGIAISRQSTSIITGSATLTTTRTLAKVASKALIYKDIFDFGVAGVAAAYCAW